MSQVSRRGQGTKRRATKTGWVPRAPTVKSEVKKILAQTVEKKFVDVSINKGDLDKNGYLNLISTIAQGTTQSTRIGDGIFPKSISFRLMASMITSGTSVQFRYCIIQWNENSTPSVANILQTSGTDMVHVSPFNFQYKKQRFQFLHDSGPVFCTYGTVDHSSGLVVIPLSQKAIHYTPASSTDSDTRFYFLACCFLDAPATDLGLRTIIRMTYTDA